MKNVFRFLFHF